MINPPGSVAALAAVLLLSPVSVDAQSWTTLAPGTSNLVYTVHFANAQVGWIGGEGALIRKTTDGGTTWTQQSGNRNITAIHFIDADTGWAVGGSGGTGTILRTTNGGTNWSIIANGSIAVMWSVQFLDASRGWAAGAGGTMLKSTNGGLNWTPQSTGTSVDFRDHHFVDTSTGWVVGFSGTILKTTNGGANWSQQVSGTTAIINDVFFLDADTGWCAAAGGLILKTTNGGATWIPQVTGTSNNINSLFFLNGSDGIAVGAAGTVLRTGDGGASWAPEASGTSRELTSVHMLNAGTGWISGLNGTVLKAAASSPSALSYPRNPAIYTVNVAAAANTPTISGASPFTYTVSPALPPGLALNPSTGTISGTPSQQMLPADFVITASNQYGSTSVVLNIDVIVAPSGLSYAVNPAHYTVGTAISPNPPTVTGPIAGYTVSPPLPAGLTLNTTTGVITGTPTAPVATANHTITASNRAGASTTTVLSVSVLLKPSAMSYADNPAQYTRGTTITPNVPTLQGSNPMAFTVSPPLPAGLNLDAVTGVITGTPTISAPQAFYTITATNTAGSTIAVIVLTVNNTSGLRARAGTGTIMLRIPGMAELAFGAPEHAASARIEILDPLGKIVWRRATHGFSVVAWPGNASPEDTRSSGAYAARVIWQAENGTAIESVTRAFTRLR